MIELDKIYNEDCLIGMQRIPDGSVDCIICDLPYGTTACAWDTIIPFEPLWEQYKRIRKPNAPILLFGSEPFSTMIRMSNLKEFRYDWIWDKQNVTGFMNAKKMPLKCHEVVSVFYESAPIYNPQMVKGKPNHVKNVSHDQTGSVEHYNGMARKNYFKEDPTLHYPRSIISINRESRNDHLHPTQKPVDLIRYLIRTYTNEGETILDNCMGSGTTAIACHREKRHFIGFELNKKYYDKALKRIKLEQQQLTLF